MCLVRTDISTYEPFFWEPSFSNVTGANEEVEHIFVSYFLMVQSKEVIVANHTSVKDILRKKSAGGDREEERGHGVESEGVSKIEKGSPV